MSLALCSVNVNFFCVQVLVKDTKYLNTPFHGKENVRKTKDACLSIHFNSPINVIALCKEEYTQIQTQHAVKQLQTTGENDLWVSSTGNRKRNEKQHIPALFQLEMERECFVESLG